MVYIDVPFSQAFRRAGRGRGVDDDKVIASAAPQPQPRLPVARPCPHARQPPRSPTSASCVGRIACCLGHDRAHWPHDAHAPTSHLRPAHQAFAAVGTRLRGTRAPSPTLTGHYPHALVSFANEHGDIGKLTRPSVAWRQQAHVSDRGFVTASVCSHRLTCRHTGLR